jgi:hypothetical protein
MSNEIGNFHKEAENLIKILKEGYLGDDLRKKIPDLEAS